MGSSRLPGKVMRPICGQPMLQRIVALTQGSSLIDKVVIATTCEPEDEILVDWSKVWGCAGLKGPTHDILGRLCAVVKKYQPDYLVSLTGDNPFIDGKFLDKVIELTLEGGHPYSATTHMQHADNWCVSREFPTGISVQVISSQLLLESERKITCAKKRAGGLHGIYNNPAVDNKLAISLFYPFSELGDVSGLRMTVDTIEDLEVANIVHREMEHDFSTQSAISFLTSHPEVTEINGHVCQKLGLQANI